MVTKEGLRGMTSNPSIFDAAIAGSSDYDVAIAELRCSGPTDAKSVYESLAIADIRAAANIFRPVYDESDGGDGYVSMEVSPELAQTPPPPSLGHVALGNCRPVQRDGEGAGHRRRHLGHPGAARCWHQRQCCRATWPRRATWSRRVRVGRSGVPGRSREPPRRWCRHRHHRRGGERYRFAPRLGGRTLQVACRTTVSHLVFRLRCLTTHINRRPRNRPSNYSAHDITAPTPESSNERCRATRDTPRAPPSGTAAGSLAAQVLSA